MSNIKIRVIKMELKKVFNRSRINYQSINSIFKIQLRPSNFMSTKLLKSSSNLQMGSKKAHLVHNKILKLSKMEQTQIKLLKFNNKLINKRHKTLVKRSNKPKKTEIQFKMMLKGKTSSLKVNKLKKTNSNSQLSKRTILTNQKANKKEWVCTKAINKCSTNKSRGQMLNNRTKVNLLKWRTMGCLN